MTTTRRQPLSSGTRLIFIFLAALVVVVFCYTVVSARQSTSMQVIDLPDPPGYQESLPNPPAVEQAEQPQPSAAYRSFQTPRS